jgi:hypothetical protein
MLTDAKPKSTRIFSLPVTLSDIPSTLMLYTNDLQVDTAIGSIMVVPFPNEMGSIENIALMDASVTKDFRNAVRHAFPIAKNFGAIEQSARLSSMDSYARVVEVGNYNCSVVSGYNELLARIDWRRFTKPYNFMERLSVFNDASLNLSTCGFVVAQSFRPVKNDGFGIVYPGRTVLFPTCHE